MEILKYWISKAWSSHDPTSSSIFIYSSVHVSISTYCKELLKKFKTESKLQNILSLFAPKQKVTLDLSYLRGGSFLTVHWGVETKMGGYRFFSFHFGGVKIFLLHLGGVQIFSISLWGGTDLFSTSLYSYFSNLRMSHFKHLRGSDFKIFFNHGESSFHFNFELNSKRVVWSNVEDLISKFSPTLVKIKFI